MDPDARMLPWLAAACREARRAANIRPTLVAATADVDQATIVRFEQGRSWPRDPDRLVGAYATVLELDPADLWQEAVRLWDQER